MDKGDSHDELPVEADILGDTSKDELLVGIEVESDAIVEDEQQEADEESGLSLFQATGIRNPEYWQCIRYIAPSPALRKWKTKDAIGVYCIVCKSRVPYDATSNPRGVQRHMQNEHSQLLQNYRSRASIPEYNSRKRASQDDIKTYFRKMSKVEHKASANNQMQFNKLLARWTAFSLRPFSIVEDKMLAEIITFASSTNGKLELPSRNTNRKVLMNEYAELKATIEDDIRKNCLYFSATTDMWSSRSMAAFMAVTLHFLTADFILHNYNLEVKPVEGKHTGDMIRQELVDSFERWDLNPRFLSMMLRDSGSNIVKACKDWNIPHFPCIGHSLHLIVGPFLAGKKRVNQASSELKESSSVDAEVETDCTTGDDAFEDSFNIQYSESELVIEVRELVEEVRKLTSFVKNSTKSTEKIQSIQRALAADDTLKVKMDVRTRWNSTLDMLNRIIRMKSAINDFLSFYNSAEGAHEYRSNRTKLHRLTDEDWALLEGLCYLLTCFSKATTKLSGENYSTFVSAMPILRRIKEYLCNPLMFKYDDDKISPTKKKFYDLYGSLPFFGHVITKLSACQTVLATEFRARFQSLSIEVLWSSLLDPRFGVKSSHWKDQEELDTAKQLLTNEVEAIAIATMHTNFQLESPNNSPLSNESASVGDDDFEFDFHSPNKHRDASVNSDELKKAQLKVVIMQEVQAYLVETEHVQNCNPLEWWRVSSAKYPNVAACARKWLSVPATSTPSERVFSICGLVSTCKRSRLIGESIEAQVFLHNNQEYCRNI